MATLKFGSNEVELQPRRGKEREDGTVEPVVAGQGEAQPSWRASLDAMQRLLERQTAKTRARSIKLVVSNEFVRYALTPWTAERLTEKEREQFVRALLADQYGERTAEWLVCVEPERFERPALAAAIDAELVLAARSLAERCGRRLVSMVPGLVHKLEVYRKALGKAGCGWIVDGSDGRLASLAFAEGSWALVANERCGGPAASLQHLLPPVLRRDAIRVPGLLTGTVFAADAAGLSGVIDQTWPVVRLDGAPLPS